jgi:PKD repeat protein
MLDLNSNLQPLGDGYLVSGSFFREYESIDPDHTMISFGGRTRKGDTLRYRIKNLANNTEQQFSTISSDNWTARGLILDLNHSTGQIDTIAQITSMRYKKWPTETHTYLVKKDFVQILSYFDSTVFINGEEIKDPDINAFNVLSYHLPTKSTFAIDLKNCSYSGGYFFNHSSVAGSVIDTFNFAFTSGEKFIAETRSNFNNASHVLSKYNPGNLNILWARSTTFPNVDILSTKIYQSTQNLTIYGEAVSPKQDLEPYIRENTLTDVGKKLVVYNCTPISYFEAYPNEGFYVQFLNLSDRNATYKWHFTSRDSSTEINPRHKFGTVDGTYTITLIATNECGSDSFSRDIIIDRRNFINIKDLTLTSSISVFPNPTRYEHITISNSTNEGINEVLLYDHYGRLVKSSIYDNQNSHTIAFETGNIPSGNYTLAVKTDENIFYKKVIVIK